MVYICKKKTIQYKHSSRHIHEQSRALEIEGHCLIQNIFKYEINTRRPNEAGKPNKRRGHSPKSPEKQKTQKSRELAHAPKIT